MLISPRWHSLVEGEQVSKSGEVSLAGGVGRVIPVRIGEGELSGEASPAGGSGPTSTLGNATQRVADAFERADAAIVAVASSVAGMVNRLAARTARPDRVEV